VQLAQLADAVGWERILVVHGTVDRIITYPHAEVLVKKLGLEESGGLEVGRGGA